MQSLSGVNIYNWNVVVVEKQNKRRFSFVFQTETQRLELKNSQNFLEIAQTAFKNLY